MKAVIGNDKGEMQVVDAREDDKRDSLTFMSGKTQVIDYVSVERPDGSIAIHPVEPLIVANGDTVTFTFRR